MHTLRFAPHRFAADDRGTVAIIFGLISVVFFTFAGISIDLSRVYGADTRALAALDAALLAAGDARNRRSLSDSELETLARQHFENNVARKNGLAAEFTNFRLTIGGDGDTFTGNVDVRVPLAFAGLVSIDEMSFTATSTATFEQLDLELGLMLDVTGSMNWTATGSTRSKLDVLKRAVSNDLIGTLLPDGDNPRIRIGYAPYSAAVNVGGFANAVRDPNAPSADSCVVERDTAVNGEDAPAGNRVFRSIEVASADLTRDQGNDGRYGYYRCPNAEVLPLTSDKSELIDTINGYAASGRTAGHLGIAWAWYLVSPEWAAVWGAASAPKPYPTEDLLKAVVLFTDGQFNAAYDGSDFFNDATATSYDRTSALCQNIRNREILVFSIGFEISSGSQAANALEACASTDPDTGSRLYFPASNEEDLREAFRRIANQLTRLRISR
ncbi:MAG: pilus assembly protein TadG-related protein [Pseudomonadota bacterium]